MRILHVSAHFPPNFVSGGTLVPQRLARSLRKRGHQISVYSGYLDRSRSLLETWTEEDETGLPVRWVVTTPWTSWSDRANFDNPAVAIDFAMHLRELRPDLVHFHSLQSLGAGVLREAHAAGARVVVTMHDFWWICGRQFLVDRSYQPCSLIVAAGTCACDVDREWLEERNTWLAGCLRVADVILAPSRSAKAVLVANGLDADLVHVDENGLPEATAPGLSPRGNREPNDIVRFLFTGGADPMKGWQVLERALHHIRDLPGWSLDAFGMNATDSSLVPDALVRLAPAYSPSQLPAVLASHDVLVLPSVMREAHSIVTREALSAGLAIVCTDTLGPEEVVQDGTNGVVVPAADANALAGALRRLISEPEALAALRVGAKHVLPRPLDDQVDALECLYHDLLHRDSDPSRKPTIRLVLFVCGIDGAPLRYRAWFPAEALRLLGIRTEVRHYRDREIEALANAADVVVFYRVPATRRVLDVIERIRTRTPPVPLLFDVDDLIFDPALRGEVRGIAKLDSKEMELWWQGVRRYRTTMESCDVYVGSTEALCRHAEGVVGIPARRFANGAGLLLARASDAALRRDREPGRIRLGYFSGTLTHDRDWSCVEEAVLQVMRQHREVELWLGGTLEPTSAIDEVRSRVTRLPLVPWWKLTETLRDVDVNLAPLELGNRFNEAKSAVKWLEAALVETPTVATPTQPFREAIRHERTGLLAGSGTEWTECLDRLVVDPALRRRLGTQARRKALLELTPYVQGTRYRAILDEARVLVREGGHRLPSPIWAPEALDEPYESVDLEAYELPALDV